MELENSFSSLYSLASSKTDVTYQNALIILNSIKETINIQHYENNKTLSTVLFASIFSLLKKNLLNNNHDNTPSLLFLLNNIIPKLKLAILQTKSNEIFSLLTEIYRNSPKSVIIGKYTVAIIIQILQVQSKSDWENDKLFVLVSILLENIIDEKTQVRKQITKSLVVLLERKDIGNKLNNQIKDFILKCIESEGRQIILISNFLMQVLKKLPNEFTGDICYSLIKFLKKNLDEEISTHIYLIFETLMKERPLSFDLSEDLLKEFLNNPPSFYSEEKLVFAFIQCLSSTLIHLHTYQSKIANKYISSCLSSCSELLLVENPKFPIFAQKSIEFIIIKTISKELWQKRIENNLFDIAEIDLDSNNEDNFRKIVYIMKYLLSSRFEHVRPKVLNIINTFFGRLDETCFENIVDFIQEFSEYRKELQNLDQFNSCIGKAIQTLTIPVILTALPISVNGDPLSDTFENENNLWLIPILMKHLKTASLSLFLNTFFPLIETCKYYENSEQSNIRKKIYNSIIEQFWQIFPHFSDIKSQIDETKICALLDNILIIFNGPENETIFYQLKGIQSILSNKTINERTKKIFSPYAEKLIPKLVKLIKLQRDEKSQIALNTIHALAGVADSNYLDRVFEKNITKFLETKDLERKNFSQFNKDLDILLAISWKVELRSNKWQLAMQLTKKFIACQNFLQKKAYKLLLVCMDNVHESFLNEIMEILKNNTVLQSSSRHLRMCCLKKYWLKKQISEKEYQNLDEIGDFLQTFLGEILVSLKETNRRARNLSNELFIMIATKMNDLNVLKEFLSMISAGLAGSTSLMKADTILAISKIFEKFGSTLDKQYFFELKSLIFMLINDKNKETFYAILSFLKVLGKLMDKETLISQLPDILQNLFEIDTESRDLYRSKIRHLLTKYIKKVGKIIVENSIPEQHKKFVKYIVKNERMELKKRKETKRKAKLMFEEIAEKKLKAQKKRNEGIEIESDEEDGTVKDNFGVQFIEEENTETNTNNLLLKYDLDKEKFHFVEHPIHQLKEKIQKEEENKKNRDIEITKGKIVVKEMKEITGKKRRREDNDEITGNEENKAEKEKASRIEKTMNMFKKISKAIDPGHIIKESGQTYKPKGVKTKGDLSLPGKPNPYAFIQLNPKVLNKRFKNKAAKSFDVVLNQKKSGALKGLKEKKIKLR